MLTSDLGEHGHAKRILFCEIARYEPEHRAVLGSLAGYLREFALHEVEIQGPVQQQTLTKFIVRG